MIDLDSTTTQAEFGELVGMSQPAVSAFAQRGVLAEGGTLRAWLLAYCDHMREMAAGRATEGGLVLATERARLAREQADRVAMQNAVTRGELAPAHMIEEVLAKAGARAAKILDTIPGEIRRRAPALTSDDIGAIALAVAKARNIAAVVSLADLELTDVDAADAVPAPAAASEAA